MASGNASRSRPYRRDPQPDDDEGKQACAMGRWCHAATCDADGIWRPALTFQAYCAACRGRIASCLADLPAACVRMLVLIGERPRTGKAVRVPPGPCEPIRLEIDALVRETAFILGSWHERVAAVARLSAPGLEEAVQHPAEITRDAEKVLSAHLDALLALPPEPMTRVRFSPKAAEKAIEDGEPGTDPFDEGRVISSGEAYLAPALDGTAAGREILDLHHRARKITGEVRAQPEPFDGVPCRVEGCEDFALERPEPPSDPERPAMHSRCASCGDEMTREEFGQHARRYSSWAQAAGIPACRRCSLPEPDHEECCWHACGCQDGPHPKRPRSLTSAPGGVTLSVT